VAGTAAGTEPRPASRCGACSSEVRIQAGNRGLCRAQLLFQRVAHPQGLPHRRRLSPRLLLKPRALRVGRVQPGLQGDNLLLALQKGGLVNGQVNWPGVMPSELAALCPSLHVVRLLERTG